MLDKYPELPWSTRLYLTGVFEKLRFPEHEAALIQALGGEEDEDLRADIARTLTLYDTESSLARAWKAADELYPGGEWDALMDALFLKEILSGSPTKKALRHFEGLNRRMKRSRERFSMLEHGLLPNIYTDNGNPQLLHTPHASVIPFRREEPRVGRNEPCPCGSGKKFKKCCAK